MPWPDFALSTAYATIITKLNTGFTNCGKLFKNQTTGDFTDQIRYNSTGKKLEYWTGAAWAALDVSLSTIATATNADTVDTFHASQTPAASQVPVLNASGVMPSLAGYTTKLVTNFDTIVTTGWYDGNSATGTPAAGWVYVYHLSHSADPSGYAMQIARQLGAAGMWTRIRSGGTWGAWSTVWHSTNDGTGSGMDADLLDGKQWVSVLNSSTVVNDAGTTLINLRAGGAHKFYRMSVYTNSTTDLTEFYTATGVNAYITRDYNAGGYDHLLLKNYTGGSITFYYQVDVWE
jgi:hypothetical protein